MLVLLGARSGEFAVSPDGQTLESGCRTLPRGFYYNAGRAILSAWQDPDRYLLMLDDNLVPRSNAG